MKEDATTKGGPKGTAVPEVLTAAEAKKIQTTVLVDDAEATGVAGIDDEGNPHITVTHKGVTEVVQIWEAVNISASLVQSTKGLTPTTNGEIGEPGQIFYKQTEQYLDKIRCVAVSLGRTTRALFEKYDSSKGSQSPICSSGDNYTPNKSIELPISGECGSMEDGRYKPTCPKAVWVNNEAPPCKESEMMTFFDIDRKVLFTIFFRGLSIGPFRKWRSGRKERGEYALIKGERKVRHELIEISSKPSGENFVLTFVTIPPIHDILFPVIDHYVRVLNTPVIKTDDSETAALTDGSVKETVKTETPTELNDL